MLAIILPGDIEQSITLVPDIVIISQCLQHSLEGRIRGRHLVASVSSLLPAFNATVRLPITIHLTPRARTGATLLLGYFQIGFIRADFYNLDTEFSLPGGRICPTLRSLLRRSPNREEGVEREKERKREREREREKEQAILSRVTNRKAIPSGTQMYLCCVVSVL